MKSEILNFFFNLFCLSCSLGLPKIHWNIFLANIHIIFNCNLSVCREFQIHGPFGAFKKLQKPWILDFVASLIPLIFLGFLAHCVQITILNLLKIFFLPIPKTGHLILELFLFHFSNHWISYIWFFNRVQFRFVFDNMNGKSGIVGIFQIIL